MKVHANKPGSSMRDDWNTRARGNWRYFIAAHAASSEEVFRCSGQHDYEDFVSGFLREMHLDPSDKVVLEIGCGAGRMTEFFARDFKSVIALDVSREMMVLGRSRVPCANVLWVCGDGASLSAIADNSADFVFSYKVFQHIRELDVIAEYLKDVVRVVRCEGWVKFQIMNHPHISVGSWVATLFISRRWRVPRIRIYRPDTLHAAPVDLSEVLRLCRQAGLCVEDVSGRRTQNAWLRCRKQGMTDG